MVAQHGLTVIYDYLAPEPQNAPQTPRGIFFSWKKSFITVSPCCAGANPCCRRGEFAPQLPCRGVYARSCQKATALAAATLSESTPQAIGMRTV